MVRLSAFIVHRQFNNYAEKCVINQKAQRSNRKKNGIVFAREC